MISPSRFGDDLPESDLDPAATKRPAPHPLDGLKGHLAELREYVTYYLATRADLVKAQLSKAVLMAAMGLLAGVLAIAALFKAVTLLFEGAANGLAELLGDRLWAGQLIVGGSVLALVAIVALIVSSRWKHSSRQQRIETYARRQAEQRDAFGHNVAERAESRRQSV